MGPREQINEAPVSFWEFKSRFAQRGGADRRIDPRSRSRRADPRERHCHGGGASGRVRPIQRGLPGSRQDNDDAAGQAQGNNRSAGTAAVLPNGEGLTSLIELEDWVRSAKPTSGT